jgi:Zn-dependent metalloprotease
MSDHCSFIPDFILENIARYQAREGLDPSPAQRSAVVSAQFRRARNVPNPAVAGPAVDELVAGPDAAPEGLTVPTTGTAGRLIYDDQHNWPPTYDTLFVRGEGDPDVAADNANNAYESLGSVRDYYHQKLGRNSIDNAGLNIKANVNLGVGFDNAFWEPNLLLMAFGNGSGVVFKDLTSDLDVAAHELTHGVTQFSGGLNYTPDQSGALNESFSDMLGSAIDAWVSGRDENSHDWLIGEEVMADSLPGEALRNMAEPGTAFDNPIMGRDPQPRDMSGYFEPADPHLMSGITNRWFYLICREIGIDAGALIIYQTLQNLWPTAVFADAATVAVAQARILAESKKVPREAVQVIRSAARQQGFW